MGRKRIAVPTGNGLIASGGDDHKAQERMLLPEFGAPAVREILPLFWSKAHELVSSLHDHIQVPEQSVIEVTSWSSRAALDIIGVAAWGVDFAAISQPHSKFLSKYAAMFDISEGGTFIFALSLFIPMRYAMHIPCPYNRRLKQALATIRTKCHTAVQERFHTKEEHHDILSLLIHGGVRDEDALVNQMMTILAAGHDSSSLTIAWACHALGRHQQVQQRLREEIRTSGIPYRPGTETDQENVQNMQSLDYLHAVANEILRLYTSVPFTRREANQSTTVQGHYIPSGGHFVSSAWVTNRMPEQCGSLRRRLQARKVG